MLFELYVSIPSTKTIYVIFKEAGTKYHLYPFVIKIFFQGPKGLGDPNYRGLSKMENDPMVTQRMRDIARTAICKEYSDEFVKCSNVAVS